VEKISEISTNWIARYEAFEFTKILWGAWEKTWVVALDKLTFV